MVEKNVQILLIEDNPADVRLTQEAFSRIERKSVIHLAENGEVAIDFLKKRGAYCNVSEPSLVLLDLNIPLKSGREVLAEIRSDANLCHIPVIILTTSEAENDIREAYRHSVNCYLTKPVDFGEFLRLVKRIDEFWFGCAKLPA